MAPNNSERDAVAETSSASLSIEKQSITCRGSIAKESSVNEIQKQNDIKGSRQEEKNKYNE